MTQCLLYMCVSNEIYQTSGDDVTAEARHQTCGMK
jgi:hypothetical protein